MKILILSNLYPPNELGGYERLCFSIAQGLVEKGHEIVVLTSDYGGNEQNYEGQKIIRGLKLLANSKSIYLPLDFSPEQVQRANIDNIDVFKRVLNEEKPDVVFVWNLYFFNRGLIDAIKNCEGKTVYFLSDNWLVSFTNPVFLQKYFAKITHSAHMLKRLLVGSLRKVKNLFSRKEGKFFNQRAIFASKYMEKFYKMAGVRFSDYRIIHNCIDFSNINGKKAIARDYFLIDRPVNLLFAGRIVNVKGVHVFVKALALLISKYKFRNFKVTLIGDTKDVHYVENLKTLIAGNDLGNFVEFKDNVSEDSLFEEFQKYDIYVFPSLYEPFSLTLIYALAAGIPTIASDIGGNPEIITNEETGLLYRANDPQALAKGILRLIKDSELRKHLSESGIRTVSTFTMDKMVSNIEKYLKQ